MSTPGVLALEALEVTLCFDITVLNYFYVFRCRLNWAKSNDVCHEYRVPVAVAFYRKEVIIW